MRIREASTEDHARVAELTLAAYRTLPEPMSPRYERIIADVGDRVAEGALVLVAEDERGRVVGSVTLVLDDGPYFEHEWGHDGDAGFRMLAVDPSRRGRGVGRALIGACIDGAVQAGRRRIVITTMPWMSEAKALYASFGFERFPAADRDYSSGRGLAYVLSLDGSPVPASAASHRSSDTRGDC